MHDEVILNEDGVIHGGTFLLAEEAKIGTYTIQVVGKGSASCSFAVEEYVLPKFGVEIQGRDILKTPVKVKRSVMG